MEAAPRQDGSLSDVMIAMDVVDTLRHQQVLIDRELNAGDRDRRLVERLRDIYAAQGIEVPDAVLEEGVQALKENRFAYSPPAPGLQTRLASLYVRREHWLKPVLLVLTLLVAALVAYQLLVRGPAQREAAVLPAALAEQHQVLLGSARGETARERIEALYQQAQDALRQGNREQAVALLGEMRSLQGDIAAEYSIRVVSRPGERSGIWRVPEVNPEARNYYLIVEAVDSSGAVVSRTVRNEEDGKLHRVEQWGLRVDGEVFNRFLADKQDDGIIQQALVGSKRAGYLEPEYSVPTTGATITSW
jgi:Family of unknown function (DUF6384)